MCINKIRINFYCEQVISFSKNEFLDDSILNFWPEIVKGKFKAEELNSAKSFYNLDNKKMEEFLKHNRLNYATLSLKIRLAFIKLFKKK